MALIAGLYPPGDVALYLDRAATEANVKSNPLLAGARRIHFATHGLIDEQHPLLSGLALTRTTAGDDDGGCHGRDLRPRSPRRLGGAVGL